MQGITGHIEGKGSVNQRGVHDQEIPPWKIGKMGYMGLGGAVGIQGEKGEKGEKREKGEKVISVNEVLLD